MLPFIKIRGGVYFWRITCVRGEAEQRPGLVDPAERMFRLSIRILLQLSTQHSRPSADPDRFAVCVNQGYARVFLGDRYESSITTI